MEVTGKDVDIRELEGGKPAAKPHAYLTPLDHEVSGQARSDCSRVQWSANQRALRERLGTRRFICASIYADNEAARALDIIESRFFGMTTSVLSIQDIQAGSPKSHNVGYSSSCKLGCTLALREKVDDRSPLREALTDLSYS